MSLRYEIESDAIRIIAEGPEEYAARMDVLQRALETARLISSGRPQPVRWHLLFDVRESDDDLSPSELRAVADVVATHRGMLTGRCAMVAGDRLHYGLSRMFAAFVEGVTDIEVEVLPDLDRARGWLDADPTKSTAATAA